MPLAATVPDTEAQSAYQSLTFSLSNSPAGAGINAASGAFVWVTTNAVAPRTNWITVRVTDNGLPPLTDSKTFAVTISAPPQFIGASVVGTRSDSTGYWHCLSWPEKWAVRWRIPNLRTERWDA